MEVRYRVRLSRDQGILRPYAVIKEIVYDEGHRSIETLEYFTTFDEANKFTDKLKEEK